MRIAGVHSTNYIYGKIASGKRIQTAADDAAGLAIAQKLKKNSNALDVGASNIRDGIGVANIKDSALGTMQESLQRIRELSVKASNGLYGDSEKQMIQGEVDQLLKDIEHTAVGTSYNELKLLDGSMADMHLALNPQGGGLSIKMEDMTLENLGIKDYSVTGKFDISTIDDALEKVSSARSSLGAQSNAVEVSVNTGNISSENMVSSMSSIEDLDVGQYMTEQKKGEVMQQYGYFVQSQQMQMQQDMVSKLLGM